MTFQNISALFARSLALKTGWAERDEKQAAKDKFGRNGAKRERTKRNKGPNRIL